MKLLAEEEKRKRDQMNASKKGLESKIDMMQNEIDDANRRNEDQQKLIRKLQVQCCIIYLYNLFVCVNVSYR